MKKDESINVVIRKREQMLFEGEAGSFTSYNETGIFDILSDHANFISLIKERCIITKIDGTTKEIKIDYGLVRVKENKVTVFLGI